MLHEHKRTTRTAATLTTTIHRKNNTTNHHTLQQILPPSSSSSLLRGGGKRTTKPHQQQRLRVVLRSIHCIVLALITVTMYRYITKQRPYNAMMMMALSEDIAVSTSSNRIKTTTAAVAATATASTTSYSSSSSKLYNSGTTIGSCRNVSSISSTTSDQRKSDSTENLSCNATTTSGSTSDNNQSKKRTLYRRAVHVIHRHGDRTPITPLMNESYWYTQLIPQDKLDEIAKHTKLIEPENDKVNTHNANGRGPFGKLTSLGLQQMIDLGIKLREQLAGNNDPITDAHDPNITIYPHIFTPYFDPLLPESIRVRSTNFIRTIQSVQGFITGLIPEENYRFYNDQPNTLKSTVHIDIRHTNWMIPDPQPRRSKEQAILEIELSQQSHLIAKEKELLPFAIQMTQALQPLLANDARDADFGVPQQDIVDDDTSNNNNNNGTTTIKPLSWNQLAEITKCLAVRDMLPNGITKQDQERISQHAAYRWFEIYRHSHLSYLAMNTFTSTIIGSLLKHNPQEESIDHEPVMNIWSAHDSTLICLMCAFHLEQPAVWPEYGSYLMIELLDDQEDNAFYVRFSLNGQVLRSVWGDESQQKQQTNQDQHDGDISSNSSSSSSSNGMEMERPLDMIPLADLWENLAAQDPKYVSTENMLNQLSYEDITKFYRDYNEQNARDSGTTNIDENDEDIFMNTKNTKPDKKKKK